MPSRSESAKSVSDAARTTSWSAIKFILSEVGFIFLKNISNSFSISFEFS